MNYIIKKYIIRHTFCQSLFVNHEGIIFVKTCSPGGTVSGHGWLIIDKILDKKYSILF